MVSLRGLSISRSTFLFYSSFFSFYANLLQEVTSKNHDRLVMLIVKGHIFFPCLRHKVHIARSCSQVEGTFLRLQHYTLHQEILRWDYMWNIAMVQLPVILSHICGLVKGPKLYTILKNQFIFPLIWGFSPSPETKSFWLKIIWKLKSSKLKISLFLELIGNNRSIFCFINVLQSLQINSFHKIKKHKP